MKTFKHFNEGFTDDLLAYSEEVNKQAQDDEYKRRVVKYLKKKYQKEDAVNEDGMGAGAVASGPTNVTSSGAIAGMGEPPGSKSGEPGVDLRKKKRTTSDPRMFKQFRRKAPQA